MHEQSIVESLLALALENAQKAGASKILKIYVVVGELSGVVEESMDFYFSFLRQDTIAAEASLCFTRVPARLRCRKCNRDFVAENLDFRCPECREPQVEIIGGRELYIESMEVE
jgi:hydrogenase nickel incorporation protein HypA/HybF